MVRVLDVALPHMPEARTSQLPRQKPKVNDPGADLAGQVGAVGKNVTRFRPGDEVFGEVNGEVPGQPSIIIWKSISRKEGHYDKGKILNRTLE